MKSRQLSHMPLLSVKNVHCIGIGGIGISGLAALLQEMGYRVTGSDLVDSDSIHRLKKDGAVITIGKHVSSSLPNDTQLVVHTNALQPSNPEYKKAVRLSIPVVNYPTCVGELMQRYRTLVISGTHGKSTTTAMLAKIFITAGRDPSVIVGTKIPACDHGNARLGLGKHFIIEGDEYKEAFLQYSPDGLIINNIEADHLDYYKTEARVVAAFNKLLHRVRHGGICVANADDANVQKIIAKAECRVVTFGLANGDYQATHIVQHGELTRFAVKGIDRFDLAIRVPGIHNVRNALAAAILALSFGISHEVIQKALLEFNGAWRRFEIKGEEKGITVIDDYAHHPTEIKATLAAARQLYPGRKIWCIFQPHSGDRTKQLFNNFVDSFADCDQLVVTEIYRVAGREYDTHATAKKLFEAIKKLKPNSIFISDFTKIPSAIKPKSKAGDVLITMGAGTITEISDQLLK